MNELQHNDKGQIEYMGSICKAKDFKHKSNELETMLKELNIRRI